MRYRLRTLLIVLAVGPVALAWGYWEYTHWQERRAQRQFEALIPLIQKIVPQSSGP